MRRRRVASPRSLRLRRFSCWIPVLLEMFGACVVLPLRRQAWLGGQQNFEDGLTVRRSEPCEVRALILTAQDLQQAMVDISLGRFRQGIERIRVDQVAAGIPENTGVQIEV